MDALFSTLIIIASVAGVFAIPGMIAYGDNK